MLHFILAKVISFNKLADWLEWLTGFQACKFSGFKDDFLHLSSLTVSSGLIKEALPSYKPACTFFLKDSYHNITRLFL